MHTIFIATNNKGKQEEIQALLADLTVRFKTPDQFNTLIEVEEDGATYHENAQKKVLAYAKVLHNETDILILADDSGLEVDVLKGQPGIQSARFSKKPGASDADRRKYLLECLRHHPRPWKARFRCVVVLSDLKTGLHFSEGICQGEIIPDERGEHGFGYDPIFLVEGLGCTMAELRMDEKNRLSHRARAIQKIIPTLAEMISQ